jgi:hypothetical protein
MSQTVEHLRHEEARRVKALSVLLLVVGGGTYVGGFDQPVPRRLLWPDAYRQMRQGGKDPRTQFDYTFGRRSPVQRTTQKVLDGLLGYLSIPPPR